MTSTFITTNTTGAGPLFTYAANGDELTILPGVTLASTSGAVLGGLTFATLNLNVLGTLSSQSFLGFSGIDANIHVGPGGAVIINEPSSGNGGFFLVGDNQHVFNEGAIYAPQTMAFLTQGLTEVINHGSISGSGGMFMGLFGATGDRFINSGTVLANSHDDAGRDTRYNNAVFTEGGSTLISNLAGGEITAVSSEGAGVRLYGTAGNSLVENYGTIQSLQDWGVNFSTIENGQAAARLFNYGVITGGDGSFIGSDNADTALNRGVMNGDVSLGNGVDYFDNRGGTINGNWLGGADGDTYLGSLGTVVNGTIFGEAGDDTLTGGDFADIIDGGTENDTIKGLGGDDALTGGDGGDTIAGGYGDDTVLGGSGVDLMSGGYGDDTLLAGADGDTLIGNDGNDRLAGGGGIDFLTGGLGTDTFAFLTLTDSTQAAADRVRDFTSGVDIIELTQIDANANLAGDQFFSFIGGAAFSNVAGQLRYDAATGVVAGDVDGDSVADLYFVLQNKPASLATTDFLL